MSWAALAVSAMRYRADWTFAACSCSASRASSFAIFLWAAASSSDADLRLGSLRHALPRSEDRDQGHSGSPRAIRSGAAGCGAQHSARIDHLPSMSAFGHREASLQNAAMASAYQGLRQAGALRAAGRGHAGRGAEGRDHALHMSFGHGWRAATNGSGRSSQSRQQRPEVGLESIHVGHGAAEGHSRRPLPTLPRSAGQPIRTRHVPAAPEQDRRRHPDAPPGNQGRQVRQDAQCDPGLPGRGTRCLAGDRLARRRFAAARLDVQPGQGAARHGRVLRRPPDRRRGAHA